MNFSFIKDPRWNEADDVKKKTVLGVAFDRDIASDERWETFSEEKKVATRDIYFEKAKEYEIAAYPRTASETLKDVVITGAKSAVGFGETAVGLANIPTFGRAGKAMEDYLGYDPETTKELLSRFYSPAQKRANREVEKAKGFIGTAKKSLQYPSTIGHAIVESVPQMLGGAAAARKLLATGLLKVTPVWNRIIASAIGEGTVGAGSTAEGIRQQTEDGLLTLKQSVIPILTGVGTALFSIAGGRVAEKFGIVDADTFLAGGSNVTSAGVAKRIIGGGISEGAFEELPQSMQEQLWLNAALDKPLLEGVGEAAATGLLTGMTMGAGFNVFTGKPLTEDIPTEKDTEKIESDAARVENISKATTADEAITAFEQAAAPEAAFDEMLRANKEKADIVSVEIQNRIREEGLKMQAEEPGSILQERIPAPDEETAQAFEEQPKEKYIAKDGEAKEQELQKRMVSEGVYGSKDGKPFKNKSSANLVKVRLAKELGLSPEELETIKIKDGFGLRIVEEIPIETEQPLDKTTVEPVVEKEVAKELSLPVEPSPDAPQKEWDQYDADNEVYYGKEDLTPQQVSGKSIEQQKAERLIEKEKEISSAEIEDKAAKPQPSKPSEQTVPEAAEGTIEDEGIGKVAQQIVSIGETNKQETSFEDYTATVTTYVKKIDNKNEPNQYRVYHFTEYSNSENTYDELYSSHKTLEEANKQIQYERESQTDENIKVPLVRYNGKSGNGLAETTVDVEIKKRNHPGSEHNDYVWEKESDPDNGGKFRLVGRLKKPVKMETSEAKEPVKSTEKSLPSETIDVTVSTKEAIESINNDIDKYYQLLACLQT